MKIYNSLNFENFEIPSVQSLHTAKRNLSTRGIRKISHFEVTINTIQSWLCLVKLHHRLVTPKAEGSYFGPKHLEQPTLSYVHFIENAQAKPSQHYVEGGTSLPRIKVQSDCNQENMMAETHNACP